MSNSNNYLLMALSTLIKLIFFLLAVIIALSIMLYNYMPDYVPPAKVDIITSGPGFNSAANAKPVDTINYWQAPDVQSLEGDPDKDLILYGKDIIAHTADYYGPAGKISKGSTNGMNCQNCHLDAGTKVFGNNYSAVASTYPKFRARSGAMENMYKRVNDCFERSLDGTAIDTSSKEMQAIVAYINWLGKEVPKGTAPEGSGLKKITYLERAANPENGKSIYSLKCASCHQENGSGMMNDEKTAYVYPPLWGNNSYNDGAGLFRLSNFAKYIKYNMPLGASYADSQLDDTEAWDIAAYVNSLPRPHKNSKKDWPKIAAKPFDHPFGPYADGFSEQQHKYGPFQPIMDSMESLKNK